MTNQEVIAKVEELKESLQEARELAQEFYEELLDELTKHIWALLSVNDSYPWKQLIELQEKYDKMNKRLPRVTDKEFEEYIITGDLIAIILEWRN